ncbi:thiamine pyrophosphate-dependent acetolactate synthase large subunit-like protein [Bradyrhizobium diazoefficiens]
MTIRNTRTGGQILIDQLVAQGVERVTCVPGESYLAALDALHDSPIDVMICRAEGGAAMMAEAYGKLKRGVRASASSPAAPARPMPATASTSRCRIRRR